MKTMKNRVFMMVAALFLALTLVPATKAQAAMKPKKVKGVKVYCQDFQPKNDDKICDLAIMWKINNSVYDNYKVTIRNAKGKKIKTFDTTKNNSSFKRIEYTNNAALFLRGKKYINQPLKVEIQTYFRYTSGKKVYAKKVSKVIIPRAAIKEVAPDSEPNAFNVSWSKVKGAKNYTLYVCKDYNPYLSNNKYEKLATTKGTNYKFTNVPSGSIYTFYVVPNKVKVGKKRYNGSSTYIKDSASGYYIMN